VADNRTCEYAEWIAATIAAKVLIRQFAKRSRAADTLLAAS
jgi:hypothetical protein